MKSSKKEEESQALDWRRRSKETSRERMEESDRARHYSKIWYMWSSFEALRSVGRERRRRFAIDGQREEGDLKLVG